MTSYGFTVNASAVSNEDGNVSVGVNFKDSDGFKFDTTEEGSVKDVTDKLYQKFISQYIVKAAQLKKEEEKPQVKEAQPSNDMVSRLRKLERENADLKAQIASAKYKDPKYNKPSDDKARKNNEMGIKAEVDTAQALDRAAEAMKRRLKADTTTPLKDIFRFPKFEDDFWLL